MLKRRYVLMLIVIFLLIVSMGSVVRAQEGRLLKITTIGTCYANLYKDIQVPANTSVLTLEYEIRGENIGGFSYGPDVAFYWHKGTSIKYWQTGISIGLMINDSKNGSMRGEIFVTDKINLNANAWLEVKVILTPDFIFYYARNSGDDKWIEYIRVQRSKTSVPDDYPTSIIIGTGYVQSGSEPYKRNSAADVSNRTIGSVYFDNITVKADDVVIFYEDFEKSFEVLEDEYDMAFDPRNQEPVFEIVYSEENDKVILPNNFNSEIDVNPSLNNKVEKVEDVVLEIKNEDASL